jgi:hypothetical protein
LNDFEIISQSISRNYDLKYYLNVLPDKDNDHFNDEWNSIMPLIILGLCLGLSSLWLTDNFSSTIGILFLAVGVVIMHYGWKKLKK